MKPTSQSTTQEVLAGLVERVAFHNDENGFCVLRAKARGHRDLVTVVGHAATISAGEWITASGEWINDRAHGQQFKARFLKTSAPSSIDREIPVRERTSPGRVLDGLLSQLLRSASGPQQARPCRETAASIGGSGTAIASEFRGFLDADHRHPQVDPAEAAKKLRVAEIKYLAVRSG